MQAARAVRTVHTWFNINKGPILLRSFGDLWYAMLQMSLASRVTPAKTHVAMGHTSTMVSRQNTKRVTVSKKFLAVLYARLNLNQISYESFSENLPLPQSG